MAEESKPGSDNFAVTLDRIARIVSRFELKAAEPQLEISRELLSRAASVDVGVFGRFKVGKSSFLNSLVGRQALPVGVIPVTAIITRLKYGPVERATVRYLDGRKENLWKLSRAFEDWLRDSITREMATISIVHRDFFLQLQRGAEAPLSRAVRGFQDRLGQNIESALGIKRPAREFTIAVKTPTAPDISISSIFDFHMDLLWFLVPVGLFRGVIERHFLKTIHYEIEKNLSRLASQWSERINAAIQAMTALAAQSVSNELLSVEGMLEQTRSQAVEIRAAITVLEQMGESS